MMDKDLSSLRSEIDQLDEQLWEIIGKRVNVARQIGEWKRINKEPVIQAQRYQDVLAHCHRVGRQYGVREELVNEVMQALHQESVRVES